MAAATSLLAAGASAQSSPASVAAVDASANDPVAMIDQFEATAGKFEGYRRSGAKGICASA